MNICCPVCKKSLFKQEKTFVCENGHNFDIAKQGYLNLNLRNSKSTGDNPEMIKARKSFLEKGYYDFLRDKVNSLLKEDESLLDLACGEGYYTKAFKCLDKVGIDLSKSGLKIASRDDKDTLYILSSIFRSPVFDSSVDKIITIFAPIASKEIVRILKDDGEFILVRPDEDHLIELKQVVYDKPYLNKEEDTSIDGLQLMESIRIRNKEKVINEDLMNLFMMTPYYNTTSLKDKQKLKIIEELDVTFAFIIEVFKKA